MPQVKIVRRLRVLEYVGTAEFVNKCIESSQIKGYFGIAIGSIRSAWLGETNELLTDAEVAQVEAERKAKGVE